MGRQAILRSLMLCALAAVACSPAIAQQQLIGKEVDPAAHGLNTAQERSESARFRYANINIKSIQAGAIAIDLFPGVKVRAHQARKERQFRAETWIGTIDNDPRNSVTISVDPSGVVFGKIELDGRIFLIRPKSGQVHAILELDSPWIGDEGDDVVQLEDDLNGQLGKFAAESVCLASSTCGSKSVDIMVVYTAAARNILGGTHAAAQSAIAAAVAEMNTANANSGVNHTFSLVYSNEVEYAESGNSSTDLSRLAIGVDGYMDIVATWRETYGADLVSLITYTGGCGIAYIQSSATTLSPNAAFSVVRHDCLTTNKSLAHEAGHNMGLHHDWYVNSSTTPCAWHHGYVNKEAFGGTTSQRWRTVLAYNDECAQRGGFNCTRIARWSNPIASYNGDPLGVPQNQSKPADAAFALNRTICQVAEFRASVTPPSPPAAPTGLVATGMSSSTVQVAWSDNATNELGYVVQRSPNGSGSWSQVASLGAGAQSFSDTGLSGGTAYFYRTYAYNGSQSEYSNVDSAMTMISYTDYLAQEITVRYGSVTNGFSATHTNDGVTQMLQEVETDGLIQNRTSRLEATWRFAVTPGVPLIAHANAWRPSSSDGDQFTTSYSLDGSTFNPMFTVSETVDNATYQTFSIGAAAGSSVWIRIVDTDRNRGNRSIDRVYVDHLFLREQVSGDADQPPPTPPSVHLAALVVNVSDGRRWTSTIEAVVHGEGHAPEPGVTVLGVWSDGDRVECVTGPSGTCGLAKVWKPKDKSATFSVLSLAKDGMVYDGALNEARTSVTAVPTLALSKLVAGDEMPDRPTLRQNYPNPFNPSTVIEYGIPESVAVRLSVYNALGVEVDRLRQGIDEPGWHRVTFDASNLSAGVYFAVLDAAGAAESRTMLLLK